MGISDFYSVIEEHCPEILVDLKMSELAGYKIAVDISIFLNKYIKSAGAERWIDSFIILMCVLKRNGIKPVNIFDGPNPPKEKTQERERRRAEAAKTKEKIDYGKTLLKDLEKNYVPTDKKLPSSLIEDLKGVLGPKASKSTKFADVHSVIADLKGVLAKKERQNLPILPKYSEIAKELITIMGFPYEQAPGEAETLCAGLCCTGMVDAVLSEDTDVMAYGTPFMLAKIDVAKEKITVVSIEDILKSIDFTLPQFRDLCILLSCDYNSRIKGYPPDGKNRKKPASIGAKGAFLMMEEYKTLEEAEKFIEDADPLNYRRCRELFTPPSKEELSHIEIPYNKKIDLDALLKFIKKHKVRITIDYIMDSWKPAQIEFEGDEEVFSDDEDDF